MTESVRLHAQGQFMTTPFAEVLEPRPDFDVEETINTILEHAGLAVKE